MVKGEGLNVLEEQMIALDLEKKFRSFYDVSKEIKLM